MIDAITAVLAEFRHNIGWADMFDILLTTGVLYLLLTWFRRDLPLRARRAIGVLLASFLSIYILAEVLDLYLMGRVIEILFLMVLVGTVVVFQADLRRTFDRMHSWNILRKRRAPVPAEETVDILTETLETMAAKKVGALIAIKGNESWDRHLHGGVSLDGKVSQSLLYSLFNPASPAHDGALLIDEDTILKFGVHLPLSTRIPRGSPYGTRHAAALGLSERTDALVLVVSEERGEVVVAEQGSLTEVTPDELKERLEQFPPEEDRAVSYTTASSLRVRQVQTASVSLLLAASLWLTFAYSPDLWYRTFEVPIVYQNLPQDWRIDKVNPEATQLSVSGSQRAFEAFDSDNLTAVVNLEDPAEGVDQIELSSENVKLPPGLEVAAIQPHTIDIRLQKLESRRVVVEVQTTGDVASPFRLSGISSDPDSVTILHPANEQTVGGRLQTEAVDLTEITESTEVRRSLILPSSVQLSSPEESIVDIRVDLEPPPSSDS